MQKTVEENEDRKKKCRKPFEKKVTNGSLNEMFLGFRCICVWVKVSQVSKYPREIKIMMPGQTPGLVIPSGPLVPTDRRDRRHRMYGYFSVQPAHVDLDSESYPAIQSRAKKYGLT